MFPGWSTGEQPFAGILYWPGDYVFSDQTVIQNMLIQGDDLIGPGRNGSLKNKNSAHRRF